MQDANGREYAKITEVGPTTMVQFDSGFSCIEPNSIRSVFYDVEEGFHYVACACGKHALGGQLADDGMSLIGVYKV